MARRKGFQKRSASAVIARMREAFGFEKDFELARELMVPSTTLSCWKTRGSVPLKHIIKTADSTSRSLDWLILGEDRTAEQVTGGGEAC